MTDLDSAVQEYMKHFDVCGCDLAKDAHYARFYSTGNHKRDAAIIRECIRLNTEIKAVPVDCSMHTADEIIKSETARLHMLVPA